MNPDKRKTANCLYCLNTFKFGRNCFGKYCSNKCQQQHIIKKHVDDWLNGVVTPLKAGGRLCTWARNYLLRQAGNKCSICGWSEINQVSGKCPLEIHHKDGDASNCDPNNLTVLCPNCHSLTPNHKSLNRGKGFKARMYYSKLLYDKGKCPERDLHSPNTD